MGEFIREWKAPNQLEVPSFLKKPGMRFKFVSEARLNSRIAEGYAIVPMDGKKQIQYSGASDSLLGAYRVGTLILMQIPTEMVEQRNKFYADKNKKIEEGFKKGGDFKKDMDGIRKDIKAKGASPEKFSSSVSIQVSKGGPSDTDRKVAEDINALKG